MIARFLSRSHQESLPPISVSLSQGRMLEILCSTAASHRAATGRALEIGVLGGVSALSLHRGLVAAGHSEPEVVCLEISPHNARVARENFADARIAQNITV